MLGFSGAKQTTGGTLYPVDGSDVMLCEFPAAGTNEVDALRDNGVEFLTFDLEGATWDNGVASMGDVKGAWFTRTGPSSPCHQASPPRVTQTPGRHHRRGEGDAVELR